ncbi:MAG: hypothetical protein ACXVCV_00435 [Polyangia bacterium]
MIAIAIAGCGDDGTSGGADLSIAADMECAASCAACSGTEVCVSGSTPIRFGATCLVPCHSSGDCPGATCVLIDGAAPAGRYCLSAGAPKACGPRCTMGGTAIICDGDVQQRAYAGEVCGLEYTDCPHHCGDADAGTDTNPRCL